MFPFTVAGIKITVQRKVRWRLLRPQMSERDSSATQQLAAKLASGSTRQFSGGARGIDERTGVGAAGAGHGTAAGRALADSLLGKRSTLRKWREGP